MFLIDTWIVPGDISACIFIWDISKWLFDQKLNGTGLLSL